MTVKTPAYLKHPEQLVFEWLPKGLAEKRLRAGGQLMETKLRGFTKDMEPVYSYAVAYARPRYIPRKLIVEA